MNDRPPIDLNSRLALRIDEAADALGVSPNLLREHLSELPRVYVGRRIVIPVEGHLPPVTGIRAATMDPRTTSDEFA